MIDKANCADQFELDGNDLDACVRACEAAPGCTSGSYMGYGNRCSLFGVEDRNPNDNDVELYAYANGVTFVTPALDQVRPSLCTSAGLAAS